MINYELKDIFPTPSINKELQLKGIFGKKENIRIAQILVLISKVQPINRNQLLQEYHGQTREFMSKTLMNDYLQKLKLYGVVDYLKIKDCKVNQNLIISKIFKCHAEWQKTTNIPKQFFDKKFQDVRYFFVTELGEKIIPFVLEKQFGKK